MTPPIDLAFAKEDAIRQLAAELGIDGVNPWGGDYTALFAASRAAGTPRNPEFVFRSWHCVPGAVWHSGLPTSARQLPGATRLGERRIDGIEYSGGPEYAPPLDMLELPGATVLSLAGVPVIAAADGLSIVTEVSSDYAPLLHIYDVDAAWRLAEARPIAGAAFVLMGDIADGNYSHWLLDELPRLALIRDRPDATIVLADIAVPWRRELLNLLGITERRVVTLRPYEAVRAETLLVPDVARSTQHPARRGSPEVLDWLRARIGVPALAKGDTPAAPKLYIGRSDADRRRLLNEAALLRVLEPHGFVSILPGRYTVAEQIALFARASAVVALHGAAVTNIVFCAPETPVLEIFTPWHGTHAFGLIAAAAGLPYASYVAEPARMPPDDRHDCVLDVAAFWRAAEPWFRKART